MRKDGSIARHWFDLDRVEVAEQTSEFQQKVGEDYANNNYRKERLSELLAGLEKATEMDLNALSIPETGDFQTTLTACLK